MNSEAQLVANKYEVPSGEFSIAPLDSLEADPDAEINVRAGLAALRIIANTAATIMTLITAYLTAAIIVLAAEAAAAAAIAAGAASPATPAGVVVVPPLIAGGAVIAGIWGGKGAMMRGAMKRNVPPRLRKMMGTEEYVLGRVRKRAAADQLEAKAAQNFAESFITERGDQIVADISAAIKEQLAQAARRAAISIERRANGSLLGSGGSRRYARGSGVICPGCVMTRRRPCPAEPGRWRGYAARFDDLFGSLTHRPAARGVPGRVVGAARPEQDADRAGRGRAGDGSAAPRRCNRPQFFLPESRSDSGGSGCLSAFGVLRCSASMAWASAF